MKKIIFSVFMLSLFIQVEILANSLISNTPMLTLELAKKMATEMEVEAKKRNVNVVIYILGNEGRPLVIHRDENSGFAPLEWARNKAITSYQTKKQSKALSKETKVLRADTFSFLMGMKGGIPLVYKGYRLGAIGVSGAPLDVDQAIAEKGYEIFETTIK